MARLVVISKSLTGLSYQLDQRWVTVGRNPGNLFQIPAPSISGQHCEVLMQGNELLVRDLRSTNGTFIKDTLITEGALPLGAVVRLGDVELRFEGVPVVPPLAGTPGQRQEGDKPVASLTVSNGNQAGRKRQLMLVDDSMAFLELAAEVFDALAKGEWEIHKACGADQALSIMQVRQIELAVLDIAMPMLDGQQLLAMLHRRHPEAKLVILTGLADETRRAQCLAAGAELFLEKPLTRDGLRFVFNLLNDLITWRHRDGFSGTLQHVGLADIIQIECLRRSSCILEIHTSEPEGEIYIESGVLVHAASVGVSGEKALHRLLSLNDGRFQLCPYRKPPERTLQGSWERLLMESAQLRDEESSALSGDKTSFLNRPAAEPKPPVPEVTCQSPKPDIAESKTPAPVAECDMSELGDGIVVVSTYDGQWHPADSEKQ